MHACISYKEDPHTYLHKEDDDFSLSLSICTPIFPRVDSQVFTLSSCCDGFIQFDRASLNAALPLDWKYNTTISSHVLVLSVPVDRYLRMLVVLPVWFFGSFSFFCFGGVGDDGLVIWIGWCSFYCGVLMVLYSSCLFSIVLQNFEPRFFRRSLSGWNDIGCEDYYGSGTTFDSAALWCARTHTQDKFYGISWRRRQWHMTVFPFYWRFHAWRTLLFFIHNMSDFRMMMKMKIHVGNSNPYDDIFICTHKLGEERTFRMIPQVANFVDGFLETVSEERDAS